MTKVAELVSTNLSCGGDELCNLIQAVQVRNELQPQVHLRRREKTGDHMVQLKDILRSVQLK